MNLKKLIAILLVCGWVLSGASTADAAKKHHGKKGATKGTIQGTVVDSKNAPVAGAKITIGHHHKKKHKAKPVVPAVAGAAPVPAVKHKHKAKVHHHKKSIISDSNGKFTIKAKAGKPMVHASMKGVGSGNKATTLVAGQTAKVKIKIGAANKAKHHSGHKVKKKK